MWGFRLICSGDGLAQCTRLVAERMGKYKRTLVPLRISGREFQVSRDQEQVKIRKNGMRSDLQNTYLELQIDTFYDISGENTSNR